MNGTSVVQGKVIRGRVHCTIKPVQVPTSGMTHLFTPLPHTDAISCKMQSLQEMVVRFLV